MKKRATTTEAISPPLVWETEDAYLSAEDQREEKIKAIQARVESNNRLVVVADSTAAFPEFFLGKGSTGVSLTRVSVDQQLTVFNHFDLPFGCQQPTFAHAHVLATLIKSSFLPDSDLDTVVLFLRHMYHQYSNEVTPKMFRLSESDRYPLVEEWLKRMPWLKEYDRDSWWCVSEKLAQEGYHNEALLAHYQAMPTVKDFEKTLKECQNFEDTNDGRWLSRDLQDAAQKVSSTGLGVYGSLINARPTVQIMPPNCWLELDGKHSVLHKTKTVERFLCAMLMVYRATSSFDVVKHLQNLEQQLYQGNPDFDIVQPSRLEAVRQHHVAQCTAPPYAVVWDKMHGPLSSPLVQQTWPVLAWSSLTSNIGVVTGETTALDEFHQWLTTHSPFAHSWLCFSATAEIGWTNPVSLGEKGFVSIKDIVDTFAKI